MFHLDIDTGILTSTHLNDSQMWSIFRILCLGCSNVFLDLGSNRAIINASRSISLCFVVINQFVIVPCHSFSINDRYSHFTHGEEEEEKRERYAKEMWNWENKEEI